MNETLNNAETPPCFIHGVSFSYLYYNQDIMSKLLEENVCGLEFDVLEAEEESDVE